MTDNKEIEKAKIYNTAEIIDYASDSVIIKSILNKITGNVRVISFASGEVSTKRIIPFDTYIQIIEGNADILIDGISYLLAAGQSIIIPAHTSNIIRANERFKMISTIIKSGYE